MRLPTLHNTSPFEVLKRSVRAFLADDMLTYAAALAYSALFALFPFLIFLIALLGFLHIPQFFDWVLARAQLVLPNDSYRLVEGIIGDIQGQTRGGLLSIGIVVAIWSASSGVRSVMNAMNVAFRAEERRSTWKRYAMSVGYTLGLAALLIAAAALMLVGPRAIEWIADQAGRGDLFVAVWSWLRWPVLALLLMAVAAAIYALAPNVDQPFTFISAGAIVATVLWVLVSVGFSFYVSNFANYSATYGSIGGIIVLLLYFYLSSAVLLLGAEVNAELRRIDHEAATVAR